MTENPLVREFSVVLCADDEDAILAETHADGLSGHAEEDSALLKDVAVTWQRTQADGDLIEVADVEEVEWLEREVAVTTMREQRSFGHGVRLYFHAPELMFYAAIYMDDLLWRAVKSTEFELAEKAFEEFVVQVNGRARGEVRRVQLEARNIQLKRRIAESEARAERLRVNMQRNAAQKQRALERDNALRNEIKQLEAGRVQAQLHVNRTVRQIGQIYSSCAAELPRPKGLGFGYRKR